MVLHSNKDVGVTLESVSYSLAMSVDLMSMHTVQQNQNITLDATGVLLLGGRPTFPKDGAGSRRNATCLHPPPPEKICLTQRR